MLQRHVLGPVLLGLALVATCGCGGGGAVPVSDGGSGPDPLESLEPVVRAVSPSEGVQSGGTPVTITGTNFVDVVGVAFDGAPATSFTVQGETRLTCITPPHVFGAAEVAVATQHGVGFLPDAFTFLVEQPPNAFTPNDPLYANQWHLLNTGQHSGSTAGEDANVVPVWNLGYTGAGVRVAIVDDGFEIGHEDLAAHTVSGGSWDYAGNDDDPSTDEHGTSVGGVAAGVGGNGIGVTGAAPFASTVGFNPLNTGFLADFQDALSRDIQENDVYNNSWGVPAEYDGYVYGWSAPSSQVVGSVLNGIASGRGGLGCVYTKAAGNSGPLWASYDGENSTRGMVCVGAIGAQGVVSPYSQPGPMIIVGAPSNSVFGSPGITTTDRTGTLGYNPNPAPTGNYTNTFGGTSSATPLVTGVIALMLEANPNLRWHDVPLILANSARLCDPTHTDWTTNGASPAYSVNHYYGFGCVDAEAAVDLARTWTPRPAPMSSNYVSTVATAIPDNDSTYTSDTITVPAAAAVNTIWRVAVTVNMGPDHPRASDLDVILTSPSGTKSTIAWAYYISGKTYGSSITGIGIASWRHLGESPTGTWTLEVRDSFSGSTGTWSSWGLSIEGSATSGLSPEPQVLKPAKASLPRAPASVGANGVVFFDGTRWRHAQRQQGRTFRDGPDGQGRPRVLTGRLIVHLDPALDEAAIDRWESHHGLVRVRSLSTGPTWFLYAVPGRGTEPIDLANAILGDPEVLSAQPDWWVKRVGY